MRITPNLLLALLALIIASSLFQSCARDLIDQQLHFGIKAAQSDLWEEAIFRWKKVVEANPDSAAAHNNLAVAYEKKGLWEEAKKEYERALKLSPNNSYIKSNYENFKKYYEQKKEKKDEEEKEKKGRK
ncbi:MAG: tetratricopeptide repeat protein [Candidatus Aminicenantales bacterium]